jgi:hypothetical protein
MARLRLLDRLKSLPKLIPSTPCAPATSEYAGLALSQSARVLLPATRKGAKVEMLKPGGSSMLSLQRFVTAIAIGALFVAAAANDAHAQKAKKGTANSYAACKAKLSQVPPCSTNWTRNCAAQCGGR